MTEHVASKKNFDGLSAFLGALAGSIFTYVLVITWIANTVVETGSLTTVAKMESCILKVTPLLVDEIKAAEWCAVSGNRNSL